MLNKQMTFHKKKTKKLNLYKKLWHIYVYVRKYKVEGNN